MVFERVAAKGVNSSSQFDAVLRLTYSLEFYVHVVNEDVEETLAEDGALQNPSSDWTLADVTSLLGLFCA
ncbi:hypothetical protein DUI87_09923 [Hirundo rustica rustica]|uniref:Uncharacterized protein n=1 Tax=Hirundo rustica rustica TaxID=333673 RepID=A0A3M0KGN8_HIRRU|nr:hypothetical protein DUI87_09923 [Hirundo rustica rustica]